MFSTLPPQDAEKGMTELELNSALTKMLASLGDRYTRYLSPAKYATIVQVTLLLHGGVVVGVRSHVRCLPSSFMLRKRVFLLQVVLKATPTLRAGVGITPSACKSDA